MDHVPTNYGAGDGRWSLPLNHQLRTYTCGLGHSHNDTPHPDAAAELGQRSPHAAQAMQAKIDGDLERAILTLVLVAHISAQSPSI
jgi:hypothetical protein